MLKISDDLTVSLWEKGISDIFSEVIHDKLPTKRLITYKLYTTWEIYSDTVITTDPPRKFLEFVWKSWFDDDDAELISITRL